MRYYNLLGEECYSLNGSWYYLTLNGYDKEFTFPVFEPLNNKLYNGTEKESWSDKIVDEIFNNHVDFSIIYYLCNNRNLNLIIFGASESGEVLI